MLRLVKASCLFVMLIACGSVWSATGVAFVHGTGNQTNALDDYWTRGFVNSVRQGLPNQNNYVVVNCAFDQYMWDPNAAGCLAGVLHNFITTRGITDLVVITHSNGGNVMRWIMSNPTWDSRYPLIIQRTRWVNALAPPPRHAAGRRGHERQRVRGGRWAGCWATRTMRCASSRWLDGQLQRQLAVLGPPAVRRCPRASGTWSAPTSIGGLEQRRLLRRLLPERRPGDHPMVAQQLLRRLPRTAPARMAQGPPVVLPTLGSKVVAS
jgi:hypothetical protein